MTTDDVNVEMVDTLTAVLTIVDDNTVASLETLLLGNLSRDHHAVAQKLLVFICGKDQLAKSLSVLGDDQEVSLGYRIDISESHDCVIFVNNCCWDLLGSNLIEDSNILSMCCLCKCLLV